jgi:RimJ/RimL family protein N-acetyltransferase
VGGGQWAVVDKFSGTLLGRAGLNLPERPDWPGIEVGWTMDPKQWGHGYATEAATRAVEYGFGVVGADELFSVILPENTRSIAVAIRLGFTFLEDKGDGPLLRDAPRDLAARARRVATPDGEARGQSAISVGSVILTSSKYERKNPLSLVNN